MTAVVSKQQKPRGMASPARRHDRAMIPVVRSVGGGGCCKRSRRQATFWRAGCNSSCKAGAGILPVDTTAPPDHTHTAAPHAPLWLRARQGRCNGVCSAAGNPQRNTGITLQPVPLPSLSTPNPTTTHPPTPHSQAAHPHRPTRKAAPHPPL